MSHNTREIMAWGIMIAVLFLIIPGIMFIIKSSKYLNLYGLIVLLILAGLFLTFFLSGGGGRGFGAAYAAMIIVYGTIAFLLINSIAFGIAQHRLSKTADKMIVTAVELDRQNKSDEALKVLKKAYRIKAKPEVIEVLISFSLKALEREDAKLWLLKYARKCPKKTLKMIEDYAAINAHLSEEDVRIIQKTAIRKISFRKYKRLAVISVIIAILLYIFSPRPYYYGGGIVWTAPTFIRFKERKQINFKSSGAYIFYNQKIDGVIYGKIPGHRVGWLDFYDGKVTYGYLGVDQEIDGIHYKGETAIWFNIDGKVSRGALLKDLEEDGKIYKAGTFVSFDSNGKIVEKDE